MERDLTNLEIFFLLMAIGSIILAIGFNNVILYGVTGLCAFFAVGSIIKRNRK